MEQARTDKFYELKACTKYKTVPDFFYVVKNHLILFCWATLKIKLYRKKVHGDPINKTHNLWRKDVAPSPTVLKIQ